MEMELLKTETKPKDSKITKHKINMNAWKAASLKKRKTLKDMTDTDKKLDVIGAFQRKSVKEEVDNFFSETSFTALQRIYKAQSIFRRLAWTVVVLAMMVWLGIQCFWLLDRYFRYPMEVKLDLKASPELEFPSVTICNLNPILESSLGEEPYSALKPYSEPETTDTLFTATLGGWVFNDSCSSTEYSCSNGRCIPSHFVCDAYDDCNNNDDEKDCGNHTCEADYFSCNGTCKLLIYKCNGHSDCPNATDEVDCTGTATCPGPTLSACSSGGQCTFSMYFCDGYNDCLDGSDEAGCSSNSSVTASSTVSTQPTVAVTTYQSTMTQPTTSGTRAGQGRRKRDADLHKERSKYYTKRRPISSQEDPNAPDNLLKAKIKRELSKLNGLLNRRQKIEILKKSFADYSKGRMRAKRNHEVIFEKKSSSKKRHRVRRSGGRSVPSDGKDDYKINWDDILENSTFSKWDALLNNANVSDTYYAERDDEWEAAMMYAYITTPVDHNELEKHGHKKTNLIASCQFNGYQCTPLNFTYFHSHKYGNCYTFNSVFSGTASQTTRFQGPANGLRMELFINQEQYVANLATEAGARVLIHERGHMPFPEDNGISIMPGRSTSIGIKQLRFSRLPPPHGVCANSGEIEDYYQSYLGTKYSKLSCLKSCYQNIIIDECKCAHPYYFVQPNTTVCDMLNDETQKCVTLLPEKYPDRYASCDTKCPQPCDETDYDISISSTVWPSDKYEDFLATKLTQTNSLYKGSDVDDDFAKVQIYYQDLIYSHIEQQKAYESMNLISDLGGQLGLWLGLSAITIGELCSFIFSVTRSLPSTLFSGTKTSPNENRPSGHIAPASLEDMYDDMCPDEAKYIPPDIVSTDTDITSFHNIGGSNV